LLASFLARLSPCQQKQPILNDYTHLNHLKQELNQLIDREITPIDPTFSLTQKVERALLDFVCDNFCLWNREMLIGQHF